MSLWHLLLFTAVAVAGTAAVFDWRTGEMPDWLTFGAFIAGLLGNFELGFSTGGLSEGGASVGWSFLGALACGVVPFLLKHDQLVGHFGGSECEKDFKFGDREHPLYGLVTSRRQRRTFP